MGQGEEDQDLKDAGIERLEVFGDFNIIYKMTDAKPWDYDKLLRVPIDTLYMTLWRGQVEDEINKELIEIKKAKT